MAINADTSRNGEVLRPNEPAAEEAQRKTPVFRSHDVASDPAQKLNESIDRLDDVVEQLAAVMAQAHRPVAAVGSASEPQRTDSERIATEVARSCWMDHLKREVLKNGDVSYSLPMDTLRDHLSNLAGFDREAFRECNPLSSRTHIEVIGTSDRHLTAAMEFAKRKWGDSGVIIHVDDQHRGKIIEHAVRAGLTIANQNPEIQKLVAAERERQLNPISPERDRKNTPVIARASSERDFSGHEYRPSMIAQRSEARLAEAEEAEPAKRASRAR